MIRNHQGDLKVMMNRGIMSLLIILAETPFIMQKSKRLSDDKSSNENVYVASYSGQQKWSDNAAYGWYAKPGIYFYLYGWTSGAQLRTKGYYNP